MNSHEKNGASAESFPGQDGVKAGYAPFEFPDNVTNYDAIRARELGEAAKNPDIIGLNLDSSSIANPSRLRGIRFVENSLSEDKTMEEVCEYFTTSAGEKATPEQIESAIREEKDKLATFDQEIAKLPEGAKFRVHSNGEQSPFTTSECVHTNENGEKQVVFNTEAMRQIATLKEKAGSSGLTVVMNLWDKENGGNVPKTPDEIENYALMCSEFVRQAGFESGSGLTLELGNETNVNRNTLDGEAAPFNKPEFGDSSSPEEYASFYFQVADQLKKEFPDLRLSLAGTAFYDPEYVEKVVGLIQGHEEGLIDVISFHPYRGTVEEGTAEIVDNQKRNSPLSFDKQFAKMKEIADRIGAEVTVGEVSFTKEWGKSINTTEQAKNTKKTRELGTTSYIWPGGQILKYP